MLRLRYTVEIGKLQPVRTSCPKQVFGVLSPLSSVTSVLKCGDGAEALRQLKPLRFNNFSAGLTMPMRTRLAPRRRIMPFPIRLEPSKRARLEMLAKADRRSLSNYILKVLYDHIDAIETSRDKPLK